MFAIDFTKLDELGEGALKAPTSPNKQFSDLGIVEQGQVEKIESEGYSEADLIEYNLEEIGARAKALLKQEQNKQLRIKEIFGEYQRNIKNSEQLRGQILKGVKAGEPLEDLFLMAVECISNMTGDRAFLTTAERSLSAYDRA